MKPQAVLQILLCRRMGRVLLMMRIAVVVYPPLWISMLRCALGGPHVARAARRPEKPAVRPVDAVVARRCALEQRVPFTLFAWGERWVPSNTAAVLNATVPIWTLLLSMVSNAGSRGASPPSAW